MPRRKRRRQQLTRLIPPPCTGKASVAMTSEEEGNSDLEVGDMFEGGEEDDVQFLADLKP
jgi:hypothetical protein